MTHSETTDEKHNTLSMCFQIGQHLSCTLPHFTEKKSNSLAHSALEKLLSPKMSNVCVHEML